MSALEMLFDECKVIAREEIPEVMAINDQLETWVVDAERELADLHSRIAELEAEKELFELRSKEVGKSRIELYREIYNLSDYIKHIAGISNTSVQHYWPDTCETCKEIRLELEKNDSRINRLLSLLED